MGAFTYVYLKIILVYDSDINIVFVYGMGLAIQTHRHTASLLHILCNYYVQAILKCTIGNGMDPI